MGSTFGPCLSVGSLLLIACGGDDGSPKISDAGLLDASFVTATDGRVYPLYDESCSNWQLCVNDMPTSVGMLCTAHTTQASSPGVDQSCFVSPSGTLYAAIWESDRVIVTPGWTESGSATRPGTLSASDEVRCTQMINETLKLPSNGSCAASTAQ